jgi:hypothetical protein
LVSFQSNLEFATMRPSKPTIVLAPGAWHSPSHYETLLSLLQNAGYPKTSSHLPSVNSADPKTATTEQDALFVREKILFHLLDEGKDVLLVLHSYGGLPGAAAAKGLSKTARSSGEKRWGYRVGIDVCACGERGGLIGEDDRWAARSMD